MTDFIKEISKLSIDQIICLLIGLSIILAAIVRLVDSITSIWKKKKPSQDESKKEA